VVDGRHCLAAAVACARDQPVVLAAGSSPATASAPPECVMSGANLPCVLRATAPFVYVRWHGPYQSNLYGGSYSDDDLRWWTDWINEVARRWAEGLRLFQQRRRWQRSAQCPVPPGSGG